MCQLKKDTLVLIKKNLINEELNQAIMVRSKLRNKFLKLKAETDLLITDNATITLSRYVKRRNSILKT